MTDASPAGAERRKAERFPPAGWLAQVTLPRTFMGLGGGQTIKAPLLDLSEAGARIMLSQEVQKGQQVRLRIEDPKFKDVVEWMGRVAWVNPPPPVATTWIVGVEFVELPREHQLKIGGWRRYYTSEEHRRSLEEGASTKERRAMDMGRGNTLKQTRSGKAVRPDAPRQTRSGKAVRPEDEPGG